VQSPVGEGDSAPENESLDGAGDEHLVGLGERGDPYADVHRESRDRRAVALDLPRVQPGADLELEFIRGVASGAGSLDPAGGAIEGGEEAVAGGVNLGAFVAVQAPAAATQGRVEGPFLAVRAR
jgi:hypothetical protein